jgi:hypothetical protein
VGFVVDKVAMIDAFPQIHSVARITSFNRCSIFTHVPSGAWALFLSEVQFHRNIPQPIETIRQHKSLLFGPVLWSLLSSKSVLGVVF